MFRGVVKNNDTSTRYSRSSANYGKTLLRIHLRCSPLGSTVRISTKIENLCYSKVGNKFSLPILHFTLNTIGYKNIAKHDLVETSKLLLNKELLYTLYRREYKKRGKLKMIAKL